MWKKEHWADKPLGAPVHKYGHGLLGYRPSNGGTPAPPLSAASSKLCECIYKTQL